MKVGKFDRALYHVVAPLGEHGETITGCAEHEEIAKNAAREGIVLLKNTDEFLPLKRGTKLAVIGKAQQDYRKGGGGSGFVVTRPVVNIIDGIKNCEDLDYVDFLSEYYIKSAGSIPENGYPGRHNQEEEEPPIELIEQAAEETDTALYCLMRFSWEGDDQWAEDPYYSLSENEKLTLEAACKYFKNVIVVLNSGTIMGCGVFEENEKVKACIQLWYPGTFGGEILCETLLGENNPSGKLTDTIAKSIYDYPSTESFVNSHDIIKYTDDIFVGYRYFETIPGAAEKVVYPFGYGLSYTTFKFSDIEMFDNGEKIFCNLKVKNTGSCEGKEVVQIYFTAPEGKMTKPKKVLCAFAKTPLLDAGESVTLFLDFDIASMASFDDVGVISKSAFVLEKGKYTFHIGNSIRNTVTSEYVYTVASDTVTEQLSSHVHPTTLGERMISDGTFVPVEDQEPVRETRKIDYVNEYKPPEDPDRPKKLLDVFNGDISIDDFISQISTEDLIRLLAGKNTQSVSSTRGMGGHDDFDIPLLITCDGPAGVRVNNRCCIRTTCFPCATMLACTWNPDILSSVGSTGAKEAEENNLQIWLTPALNIHRNPLCGRNFEYFSEDPLISGVMATAIVEGIQSENVIATPKHFACNNKEINRLEIDTIVSERALREIYLKGFEICVKEAEPKLIMTAYNTLNGVRCAENTGLLEGVLRNEWGYKGCITTDWSNRANAAEQVLAGNDINMPRPRPDRINEYLNEGKLDRNIIAASVKTLLEMILFVD